jgi:hypothetical protein
MLDEWQEFFLIGRYEFLTMGLRKLNGNTSCQERNNIKFLLG